MGQQGVLQLEVPVGHQGLVDVLHGVDELVEEEAGLVLVQYGGHRALGVPLLAPVEDVVQHGAAVCVLHHQVEVGGGEDDLVARDDVWVAVANIAMDLYLPDDPLLVLLAHRAGHDLHRHLLPRGLGGHQPHLTAGPGAQGPPQVVGFGHPKRHVWLVLCLASGLPRRGSATPRPLPAAATRLLCAVARISGRSAAVPHRDALYQLKTGPGSANDGRTASPGLNPFRGPSASHPVRRPPPAHPTRWFPRSPAQRKRWALADNRTRGREACTSPPGPVGSAKPSADARDFRE
mmetsp:Transcript_21728/g.60417  ORF Transcript_21728/g.60417 Transcript_21728/m.60417 type:complete len:291 (+) Transcript_21728:820-1692(+)